MSPARAITAENVPRQATTISRAPCRHCGAIGPTHDYAYAGHPFCCGGCRTVFRILTESGLTDFYTLAPAPGVRTARADTPYTILDDPATRDAMADFREGSRIRITFHVPAMHCAACIWLLEHLHRIDARIGASTVSFPRREVSISFDLDRIPASEVGRLLASLGYPPTLGMDAASARRPDPGARRELWRIGLAGFAAGNLMMLSLPAYLGLNPETEIVLSRFLGWLSLGLAVPVLLFSAQPYWSAAIQSIRTRMLRIELPIAIGLAALFLQSVIDVVNRRGEGYLDSFAGLVFLLLCGRHIQRRTFSALSFDRDYRAYFPLSVARRTAHGEEVVPAASVRAGDELTIRHQELLPADGLLLEGEARMDYSFVTGESEPVSCAPGSTLHAGGRQTGAAITVRVTKAVSQSYLTSLWNHPSFRKQGDQPHMDLTQRAARGFVVAVIAIAAATALFWWVREPARVWTATTAILLVACPCALALSAPFALGTAMRLLSRRGCYLKNASVIERLATISATVFDKTGTLTHAEARCTGFGGGPLTPSLASALASIASSSLHPHSRAVASYLGPASMTADRLVEYPGQGIEGTICGQRVRLGSARWTGHAETDGYTGGTRTYTAVNGHPTGWFEIAPIYRASVPRVIQRMAARGPVALLSGDHPRDIDQHRHIFGEAADLRFLQSPAEKQDHINRLETSGHRVLMIGDGLNDAGALRASTVGIALTENVNGFSPACDALVDARAFGQLPAILDFAARVRRVLLITFGVSIAYNLTGLGFAASGHLSPFVSAVLMPISSFSVMATATGLTHWAFRRTRWEACPT